MRRWVSLGGWCGPSLLLSKLDMRTPFDASVHPHEKEISEFLPFDFVRCTLDGISELTKNGFGDGLEHFLPGNYKTRWLALEKESETQHNPSSIDPLSFPLESILLFPPDPVSIWLLFRSRHACFTHFDLNNTQILKELETRVVAWENMFKQTQTSNNNENHHRGITFLRTVMAEDPLEEVLYMPTLHDTFREAFQQHQHHNADFRTVLVVHNQSERTEPLFFIKESNHSNNNNVCIVWNVKEEYGNENENKISLFDACESGYQTVLYAMSKEANWRQYVNRLPTSEEYIKLKQQQQSSSSVFVPSSQFSTIEGVLPAVRGSCKGFGSTFHENENNKNTKTNWSCRYCSSTNGHAMTNANSFDANRDGAPIPFTEEERDILLLQYALQGGDEVAAVEKACLAVKERFNVQKR
ncbi:hypothetical protein AGDE_01901 [Angomonas deanei]|nr:hypothetical protein AGDE_01901 [Angomonas deanei]|eukprot:EPY42022.1 hypothetical protein AGDE_01901 [Angomonas deanei]